MAFVIQGQGATALGETGGGLGYSGIAPSVAVKFDLYDNAGEGTDSTGLFTGGTYPSQPGSIDLTNTPIDLHSGDTFLAQLNYDGALLAVTITDTVTGLSASQSYPVDIPGLLGSDLGYVGFSGGTGRGDGPVRHPGLDLLAGLAGRPAGRADVLDGERGRRPDGGPELGGLAARDAATRSSGSSLRAGRSPRSPPSAPTSRPTATRASAPGPATSTGSGPSTPPGRRTTPTSTASTPRPWPPPRAIPRSSPRPIARSPSPGPTSRTTRPASGSSGR